MDNKKSLLDEYFDDRHPLIELLSDPLQVGLILGAVLGALWVARNASASSRLRAMQMSPGAIELGNGRS